MNILESIRLALHVNDPEFNMSEADPVEDDAVNVSMTSYQDAVDDVLASDEFQFSMDNPPDMDPFLDDEEIEEFPIPQKGVDEVPIVTGDRVTKVINKQLQGTVTMVGELVEVAWDNDRESLEYAEELIHAEPEENSDQEKPNLEEPEISSDAAEEPEELEVEPSSKLKDAVSKLFSKK